MRVCYADGYYSPLPVGHRFPMGKFSALHRILLSERLIDTVDVTEPVEALWLIWHFVDVQEVMLHTVPNSSGIRSIPEK